MENDYLIQRKPMNALFIFALPIIVGNLFQQFYTMADSASWAGLWGSRRWRRWGRPTR